jgi:hypothetical protein
MRICRSEIPAPERRCERKPPELDDAGRNLPARRPDGGRVRWGAFACPRHTSERGRRSRRARARDLAPPWARHSLGAEIHPARSLGPRSNRQFSRETTYLHTALFLDVRLRFGLGEPRRNRPIGVLTLEDPAPRTRGSVYPVAREGVSREPRTTKGRESHCGHTTVVYDACANAWDSPGLVSCGGRITRGEAARDEERHAVQRCRQEGGLRPAQPA